MFRWLSCLFVAVCVPLVGCGSDAPQGEEESVQISTPDVEVTVDEEEGVSVDAPGAEVDVEPEG